MGSQTLTRPLHHILHRLAVVRIQARVKIYQPEKLFSNHSQVQSTQLLIPRYQQVRRPAAFAENDSFTISSSSKTSYQSLLHLELMLMKCYSKHMKRHLRPYRCDIVDCQGFQKGFAPQKDLHRHQNTCHKMPSSAPILKCFYIGCPQAESGFSRRDNYLRHLRKQHGQLEQPNSLHHHKPGQDSRNVQAPQLLMKLSMKLDVAMAMEFQTNMRGRTEIFSRTDNSMQEESETEVSIFDIKQNGRRRIIQYPILFSRSRMDSAWTK